MDVDTSDEAVETLAAFLEENGGYGFRTLRALLAERNKLLGQKAYWHEIIRGEGAKIPLYKPFA